MDLFSYGRNGKTAASPAFDSSSRQECGKYGPRWRVSCLAVARALRVGRRTIFHVRARFFHQNVEIHRLAYLCETSIASVFGCCTRRATRLRETDTAGSVLSTKLEEPTPREERYGGGGTNCVYDFGFVLAASSTHEAWSFGCVVKFFFSQMQPPRKESSHKRERLRVTTKYEDDVVFRLHSHAVFSSRSRSARNRFSAPLCSPAPTAVSVRLPACVMYCLLLLLLLLLPPSLLCCCCCCYVPPLLCCSPAAHATPLMEKVSLPYVPLLNLEGVVIYYYYYYCCCYCCCCCCCIVVVLLLLLLLLLYCCCFVVVAVVVLLLYCCCCIVVVLLLLLLLLYCCCIVVAVVVL